MHLRRCAHATPARRWQPLADAEWDALLPFALVRTGPGRPLRDARRRMDVYGATPSDFAQVKVKNSAAGVANPYARYRTAVTEEEVLASAVVADPLHLLDICATSDGGAAVLLTSEIVTNGVVHGEGPITVVVLESEAGVRVDVTDAGSGSVPTLRESGTDAEDGRGLLLVDRLASRWDHVRTAAGLTAWFELDAPAH